MRRPKLLGVALVLSVLLVSCTGKEGPTGPAGADGTNGTNGTNGNANVITFQFGTRTTTTGNIDYPFSASQQLVDSSLILAYYNPSVEAPTAWYPIPGLGSTGAYMTRGMWYQSALSPSTYTYRAFLLTASGSGAYTSSTTFTKFKIIIAPASVITVLTSMGSLDLSDYRAVAHHLNLPE